MKLTVKLIFTTLLIVALAVSICSCVLLSASFQAELQVQYDAAIQESNLFCVSMGNMALQAMADSFQTDTHDAVSQFLRRGIHSKSNTYLVLDSAGRVMATSNHCVPQLEPGEEGQILAQIFQDDNGYTIETVQQLSVEDEVFTVHLFRDVTEVFLAKRHNLRISFFATLGALAVSAVVIVAMSLYFISPIRKLSSTTRLMAQGQYARRAQVYAQDELGDLAQDFNRMADTVEHQIFQLEDTARRQRDFTASFAHEIKTPLTSVIGYADTLRSRQLTQEQQLRAADYIFSEGKRMEAMSLALLDLFALDKAAPQFHRISTRQIAQQAAQSCRYAMAAQNMDLTVDVEDAPLLAEPSLLHTLLLNLLDNARKASAPGGAVSLSGQRQGQCYLFTVVDHGRGIPPEAIAHLTEPFYMVDKSRARAEGGAGLGLALCKRIVQVHGGKLCFESAVGQGTTVTAEIGGVL